MTVSDNGPGIPEGSGAKIFDPYFTSKKEGTGLGLSIVSSIVSDHRGAISAKESSMGGLEITVSLPSLLAGGEDFT